MILYYGFNTVESFKPKSNYQKAKEKKNKEKEKTIQKKNKPEPTEEVANNIINVKVDSKPDIKVDVDTDELSNVVKGIKLMIHENNEKTKNTLNNLSVACSNPKLKKDSKIQNICNSLAMTLDSLLYIDQAVSNNIKPLLSIQSMVNERISIGRNKLDKINVKLDKMIKMFDKDVAETKKLNDKHIKGNSQKSNKSASQLSGSPVSDSQPSADQMGEDMGKSSDSVPQDPGDDPPHPTSTGPPDPSQQTVVNSSKMDGDKDADAVEYGVEDPPPKPKLTKKEKERKQARQADKIASGYTRPKK
jgi:hypothetical protein